MPLVSSFRVTPATGALVQSPNVAPNAATQPATETASSASTASTAPAAASAPGITDITSTSKAISVANGSTTLVLTFNPGSVPLNSFAGDITLGQLPATGTAGQVLTMVNGAVAWASPSAGTVTSVTSSSNAITVAGTTAPILTFNPTNVSVSSLAGTISLTQLPATGTAGQVLTIVGGNVAWATPSTSSGTVTDVTSTSNAISVATGTTTPALTFNPANVTLSALGGSVTLSQLPATGTAGQVLTMVGGNVAWATPSTSSGTVTDVTSTSNAISVATGTSTPALTFNPANVTLSSLAGTLGTTQVSPGTSGQVLTTNSSGQVVWATPSASSGTVTDVTSTSNAITVATGTTTPALTFNPANVTLSSLSGSVSLTQLPASGTAGQVLTMVSGAVAWATPAAGNAGTVTSVTSTSNAITVATGTTTPALTFNPANVTLSSLSGNLGTTQVSPGTSGQVLTTNTSGQVVWQALPTSSTTLAGDTDVSIVSPADGQFFTYSGTNSKWGNNSVVTLAASNVTGPLAYSTGYVASNFSSSNYLTFPTQSGLAFGTGDFTIEGWIYPVTSANGQIVYDARPVNTNGYYTTVLVSSTSLQFFTNNATAIQCTITMNAWQHFAVVRHSGTTTLYLNGTSQANFADGNSYANTATNEIAGSSWQIGQLPWLGQLSNLRITNNAVYTANFTAPSGPLTAITGTQLLTLQNSTFVDNSANAISITVNGSPTMSLEGGVQFGAGGNKSLTMSGPVVGSGILTGNGNASWGAGTGAPTYTAPVGSMYSRTDGATNTSLYISAGSGSWIAVAQTGSLTLAADTDVSIVNPADGQFFTYSGSSSKWTNNGAITLTSSNITGPLAGGTGYDVANFSDTNTVSFPSPGTVGTDFTIEAWIYPISYSIDQIAFDGRPYQNNGSYFTIYVPANSSTVNLFTNSASVLSGTVTLNAWQHVAFVRHSGTTTLYINGTSAGTYADTNPYAFATSNVLGAASFATSADGWFGKLSNFRITNNAVYMANFTTPTGPLAPIPGTQLLTLQNATFVDNGPNHLTLTVNGSPTLSVAYGVQFGSGASSAVTVSCPVIASGVETGNGTASWGAGTGAPTYTAPVGSMYSRTDGATGTSLYISAGSGTWTAISSGGGTVTSVTSTSNAITVATGTTTPALTFNPANVTLSSLGGAVTLAQLPATGTAGQVLTMVSGAVAWATPAAGGSTTLASDTDVSIASPADGQLLMYSGTSGKWINTSNITSTLTVAKIAGPAVGGSGYAASNFSASNYVSFPTQSGLAFGTGDFTFECWIYPTSTAGQIIYDTRPVNTTGAYMEISINGSSLTYYGNGNLIASATIGLNIWQHVAIVRHSGTLTVYVNGTSGGSGADSTSYVNTATNVIGAGSYTVGSYPWLGQLSNLRITNNAIYTSNFAAPSGPLTAVSGTQILTLQSSTFVDDSGNNITITVTGAPTMSAVSNVQFGTGATANLTISGSAIATLFQSGNGNATWTSGTGAPSYTAPVGSMYSRTDGSTSTSLYISAGSGTWNAITSGVPTLAGDTDVSISSPADGQFFTYSGTSSKWANSSVVTLAASNVTGPLSYSSGYFASNFSSSNYVSFPTDSHLAFGTGDFTIEGWIYPTTTAPAQQGVYDARGTTNATTDILFYQAGANLTLFLNGSAAVQAALTTNNWQHFALVRYSGTLTLYINGVSQSTSANSVSVTNSSTNRIGVTYDGYGYQGQLSNLRMTNNAVYTANFTTPSGPLTAIAGTQLLTLQNSTFVDNSSNATTLTVNGTPTMSAVTGVQFGTGGNKALTMSGPVVGSGILTGNGNASWGAGTGAPTYTAPVGSMYSRTDGASGSRLYVSGGSGTWTAVAGV